MRKSSPTAMSVSYPILFDTGTEIGQDYYATENADDDPGGSLGYRALFGRRLSNAAMNAFISIKSANCCANKR